ncbi:putative ER-golgi SNARE complex subunit [Lophium mytilinum]|uniref:Putative ER-golgi SNARE complex subunit n=1 Tax=Lophium mytilinum TaxID=390894 RepID=A0A6A6QZN4_9PEZI|nr:putative ER-golgi SNARE complex subunit [Lophium mytilinum]
MPIAHPPWPLPMHFMNASASNITNTLYDANSSARFARSRRIITSDMATTSIQDRTAEFRSILVQAQRRHPQQGQQGRQPLLSPSQQASANGAAATSKRSEFARRAADIGRGISGTMGKLERLAELAKRKTLFDDRPVEINELTYIIKQDLSALNTNIKGLQSLTASQHPNAKPGGGDQVGEHNQNVLMLLQSKLADVGGNFREVLEVRTKNIQASRSRTENFVNVAASHSQSLDPQRTDSPLYNQTPQRGRSPGFQNTSAAQQDLLSLDPAGSSALMRNGPQSDAQLMLMEEAQPQNQYIQQRGQAIETIESTISELGSIFGQLAQMVSEQSEQIQRIDANTEDVVDNVQGAQRELMKYWSRVSGNRWLVAKMFGVLMIFFLLWVLIAG